METRIDLEVLEVIFYRKIGMINPYFMAIIGFILMSFSAGWLTLGTVIGLPGMSWLGVIGVILFAVGIGMVITVLSTVKKIHVEVNNE